MMHGPSPDPDHYRSIPALAAYIDRIGAKQKNFRRFVLLEEGDDGYSRERAAITLDKDNLITISFRGEADDELKPTEDEQNLIKAALSNMQFPKSMSATGAQGRLVRDARPQPPARLDVPAALRQSTYRQEGVPDVDPVQ